MEFGLLTDDPLSGAVGVQRWLAAERCVHLVKNDDLNDTFAAVEAACNIWGGAYHMLVPVPPEATDLQEPWKTLMRDTDPSRTALRGRLPVPPVGSRPELGGVWVEDSKGEMPLAVIARMEKPEGGFRTARAANGIDPSDDWAIAYTAVCGRLPETLDREQLRWAHIREDVTYEQLIPVDRSAPTDPGPKDLLAILRDPALMTASQLSCARLATTTAPLGSQFPEAQAALPVRFHRARDCGPNLVVVYEPGSVSDACLLWHLRSVHGLRAGFPLGVPVTADVLAALAYWWGELAVLPWGLRQTTAHLVSASVDPGRLRDLAAAAGSQWAAVPWEEVLQPNRGCGIGSSEVAVFDSGRAWLSAVHPAEVAALGNDVLSEVGGGLELTATPTGHVLPASTTLARDDYLAAHYRGGAVLQVGGARDTAVIVWPTGLRVLDAVVRDIGYRATPSGPGRLAETLLKRGSGFGGLTPLLHPDVQELMAQLGSRHGMNWFKGRLRRALDIGGDVSPALEDRIALVEERVRMMAGEPADEEQTDVSFGEVGARLGDRAAAHAWLAWAENVGLVLRGAQVQCTHCTARSWRPLSELAPPVICRGCGEAIDRPYGYDQVGFRYRATGLLLGLVKDDAIVHALALRFFALLFRPSLHEVSPIFGGYPGVLIHKPGVKDPLGEADVLFAMIDGRLGVGECKIRANGLIEDEVTKLGRLAHVLKASWTFTATLDRAAACGPTWRISPTDGRVPHYALTAEHLYEAFPVNILGTDPLSWRDSYHSLGGGSISDDQHKSEFVASVRNMDEWRRK